MVGHPACLRVDAFSAYMTRKGIATQSRGSQLYVTIIVLAGAAVVCQAAVDLARGGIGWNWAVLALLTLLSGSATIALPLMPATVSVSETFVFTSVILFGPSAGTLTVALDAAIISFWSYRKGQPAYKVLFNVCALPLTIWVAAHLFFILTQLNAGGRPLAGEPLFRNPEPVSTRDLLGPLLIFTVVYFGLNSWIITFAIALERRLKPFAIWRDNFAKLALNYFGGASVAALFVGYTKDLDYTYLIIIVPLLVILYFTFATSVGRVEDANRHLTELNTLYMSTIETLAMAIDAKDQVTHGHIRRVQRFAIGLASKLGVKDALLIRAIEAAALLHDMGKLAVPEYILNKPGPLTKAEFEKMKLHASVGADILSSIRFPYPVVPMVRHHHENWDGTGYPDGLKNTDIPIGARILSVVDCFDALTSDRPYRPRLADDVAIKILIERRGVMYDPVIVDVFVREYPSLISDQALDAVEPKIGLSAITRATTSAADPDPALAVLDSINASTAEVLGLYDLTSALATQVGVDEVGGLIAQHIRRVIPASTCVVFIYDSITDDLVVKHASGEGAAHFGGLRFPRGQRLSGWVAANKQTILNSDPVLDLGEAARAMKPLLRSCLSTVVLVGDELVGVLTAYSPDQNAFSEEHRRFLELLAGQVSHRLNSFRTSIQSKTHSREPSLGTAGANIAQVVTPPAMQAILGDLSLSVIVVERSQSDSGDTVCTEAFFTKAGATIRQTLRGVDILFRYSADEFVVVLPQASPTIARAASERIAVALSRLQSEHGVSAGSLRVGVSASPLDGSSVERLIGAARLATGLHGVAPPGQSSAIH